MNDSKNIICIYNNIIINPTINNNSKCMCLATYDDIKLTALFSKWPIDVWILAKLLLLFYFVLFHGFLILSFNFFSENIAYKKPSRQNSNTNPPYYSDLAIDDNVSTCSYTSKNNRDKSWWNLWLSEYTTIKKLEFVTLKKFRSMFILKYYINEVFKSLFFSFENVCCLSNIS